MKPTTYKILNGIFFIVIIGNLSGRMLEDNTLDYIFKPFLMLCIMGIFYLKGNASPFRKMLFIAFGFSWLGDILLMLETQNELFFMVGLGAFLVTQILYIIVFSKRVRTPFLKKSPFMAIPFVLYGIIFYYTLFPQLDLVLKIAVFLYAISLILMVLSALNGISKEAKKSSQLILLGAFLFLLSDSMIAINKFLAPFPYAGLAIMSTYIAAQYLIMKGFITKKMVL